MENVRSQKKSSPPVFPAMEHQPALADAAPKGDSSDSMTGEEAEALPSLDGGRDRLPRGSGRPHGDGLTRFRNGDSCLELAWGDEVEASFPEGWECAVGSGERGGVIDERPNIAANDGSEGRTIASCCMGSGLREFRFNKATVRLLSAEVKIHKNGRNTCADSQLAVATESTTCCRQSLAVAEGDRSPDGMCRSLDRGFRTVWIDEN